MSIFFDLVVLVVPVKSVFVC